MENQILDDNAINEGADLRIKIQDLRPRSKFALVTFYALIIASIISIATEIWAISFLNKSFTGDLSYEEAVEFDSTYLLINLSLMIFFILPVIAFSVWNYRMSSNVYIQQLKGKEFTPGWSVGWFFIPIASLWKPYQAMKENWQGSQYIGHKSDKASWKLNGIPSFVGLWWALWVISSLLSNAEYRMSGKTEDIDGIINLSYFSCFNSLLSIAAAIMAIKIITTLTNLQMNAAPENNSDLEL